MTSEHMRHEHEWAHGVGDPPQVRECRVCHLMGNQAMWERLEALEALARQVADAGHRLIGCGQAIINYLDIQQPGKLQDQARRLVGQEPYMESEEA